jgi:DNA-binding XRE family transcriptional regulator
MASVASDFRPDRDISAAQAMRPMWGAAGPARDFARHQKAMRRRPGRPLSRLTTLRRLEAHALRRQGATINEIGHALGVSKQAAWLLLQSSAGDARAPAYLVCKVCGGVVSADPRIADNYLAEVLCLGCLARRPAAPFFFRLRAVRTAAALTCPELAARTRISRTSLYGYEAGKHLPRATTLAKLLRVLGPVLLGSCADRKRTRPTARHRARPA